MKSASTCCSDPSGLCHLLLHFLCDLRPLESAHMQTSHAHLTPSTAKCPIRARFHIFVREAEALQESHPPHRGPNDVSAFRNAQRSVRAHASSNTISPERNTAIFWTTSRKALRAHASVTDTAKRWTADRHSETRKTRNTAKR